MGKPLSRTARRSFTISESVHWFGSYECFTCFKSTEFTAQIQQLSVWDLWTNAPVFINNGLLSNQPVLTVVKDQTPSGLFFRRFSPAETRISLEEPL